MGNIMLDKIFKNVLKKSDEQVVYQFHHIGIPTDQPREGERYSSTFKMYTSNGSDTTIRVQYHRFEPDSPLHPLIKNMTHVAFKVNDMEKAIAGKPLLLGPYFPFEGFQVAIVEMNGMPIEFVKTDLSEEEIWDDGSRVGSYIYPEENT